MELARVARATVFAGVCLITLCVPVRLGAQANIPPGRNSSGQWETPLPGFMDYVAPCGVYFDATGYLTPPPWLQGLPPTQATPLIENCAVYNKIIGSNADVALPITTQGPDGISLIPNPLDIPLTTGQTSTSGSMLFNFLIQFRDSTDTDFSGEFDAEIDVPYDKSMCPFLIPGPTYIDGLQSYSDIPQPCALITPSQYMSAFSSLHQIGWAVYDVVSETLYGPTSSAPPNTPPTLIQQPGGSILTYIQVPYQTEISSTVVRVGMRFSEGYGGMMPISWGCSLVSCDTNTKSHSLPPYNADMQGEWLFSQPFTVQVQPAFTVQYKVLPAFILYQPPGDQSTSSFQMLSSYTQQYTLNTTVSLTDTTELDRKTTFDETFGGKGTTPYFSDDIAYEYDSSWDNNIKTAMGSTYGDSTASLFTTTLSQMYSTPKLPNTTPPEASLSFWEQPFWSDEIYFLANPQFAIWDYPSGPVAQPLGAAATLNASVAQLSACAGQFNNGKWATPLTQQYSLYVNDQTQVFSFTLSPEDCVNLLQLDPFWVALSQAATPPAGLPLFTGSVPLTTSSEVYSQLQVKDFSTMTSGSQTFNTTITATQSNALDPSESDTILGVLFGFKASTTITKADGLQFQIQLSTQQSSKTETSVTSTITLQDCPAVKSPGSSNATENCSTNNPSSIPVMVYQDNRFGTMLAQTPTLSTSFPWTPVPIPRAPKPWTPPTTRNPLSYNLSTNSPFAPRYSATEHGYGFAFGVVPTVSHRIYDPSQVKSVRADSRLLVPPSSIVVAPPARKRHVIPELPIAPMEQVSLPKNLNNELPALVAIFPKMKQSVTSPSGHIYPRFGVLRFGADGRPRLLQQH
jgi:hypothetical protein